MREILRPGVLAALAAAFVAVTTASSACGLFLKYSLGKLQQFTVPSAEQEGACFPSLFTHFFP